MYLDSVILAKSATKAGKIASYRSEKANGTIDDGSVATDITFYFKTPFANIFDTLNNSNGDTGWYGYDYIVNYKAQGCDKTSVAKNTANGFYSFEITNNSIEYKTSGNMIMIKVPLSELGITDYSNTTFYFKWGDSTSNFDTMEKMYVDGDVMPLGRLNHLFTNTDLN